jgi:16S rRNA A1518/A1519 N6-dimethyltransferase RsmA/KsgA/DIM1 with predicted DNA glycosylase/AP lyase activity
VGCDALAIATGYVVGKVIIGPALGAVTRKLAQREARLAAAEAKDAFAAEAKQASAEAEALKAAAAKAQAELEQDLVAASKKRADDLVTERERIKKANEGV